MHDGREYTQEWAENNAAHLRERRFFALRFDAPPDEAGGASREDPIAAGEARFRAALGSAFPALRDLLGKASAGRVYGLDKPAGTNLVPPAHNEDRDAERRWFEQYLQAGKRVAGLRLDTAHLANDIDAWWWLLRRKVCPVISVAAAAVMDADFFSWARDPYLINKLGSSHLKSAVSYGKQESASDEVVSVAWDRTSDDLRAFIIAGPRTIESVFAAALARASLSDDFLALHGIPWVKPLETLGLQVWVDTAIERKAADLAAITAALSAAETADLERDTVMNGLAAAELVAVLAGRSPATLSRKEPMLDKEVRQWAAAYGTGVDANLIRRAHVLVERVLADRAVPERVWRTAAWRRAWHEAVMDLRQRLSDAVSSSHG